MSQTNTRKGDIPVIAGEDLTGKNNYLAKIANNSGAPIALLPTANSDLALYVVVDENDIGELVALRPLTPDQNIRVVLKGTCVPGDIVVLADTGTAEDKGKVRALPASAGTYRGLGIAEEAGVDGQELLVRPASIGNIVVS